MVRLSLPLLPSWAFQQLQRSLHVLWQRGFEGQPLAGCRVVKGQRARVQSRATQAGHHLTCQTLPASQVHQKVWQRKYVRELLLALRKCPPFRAHGAWSHANHTNACMLAYMLMMTMPAGNTA